MTAGRPLLRANMNQAIEKSARCDDERAAVVRLAIFHRDADDAVVVCHDAARFAEQPCDVRLRG